jgi:protein O-GlcNAc transferase
MPADFRARSTLASLLALEGRSSAARRELAEAAAQAPDPAQRALVYTEYGNALVDAPHRDEAIAAYVKAVELQPDHAQIRLNLASALALGNQLMAAAYHAASAMSLDRSLLETDEPTYLENLLMALTATVEEPLTHRRHATRLAAMRAGDAVRLPSPPLPPSGAPLRVGYVSADFRHHAVASFFAPVLAAHDRGRLRLHLYGEVKAPDAITERLKGMSDRWLTTCGLSAAALAERIRADAIDVLVDLAGYTSGSRLDAFAFRPARVQLTWLGYPGTTGFDTAAGLDGRIADMWTDPPGLTESHFSEHLFRLPSGFIAYRPLDDAPPVASAPAERTGTLTFGSFNNAAKISDATVALWARVLAAIPGSRLLIKNHALADRFIARELRARFLRASVASERLDLRPATTAFNDHLLAYSDIDIALDTFPYHGTTTTCEALWMGVPVLTLLGTTHASRVGASVLSRTGLTEWIADSSDAFVAKAIAFTQDRPALSALRTRLRSQVSEAPLFSPVTVARELEALYATLTASHTNAGGLTPLR